MGKCYCDYCDVFLTNDSVAVRKQHNDGNRHKHNVCEYYRQYVGQQLQEQIDEIVEDFELKVSQGLVRPTYGLPPPIKTTPVNDPNKPILNPPPSADATITNTAADNAKTEQRETVASDVEMINNANGHNQSTTPSENEKVPPPNLAVKLNDDANSKKAELLPLSLKDDVVQVERQVENSIPAVSVPKIPECPDPTV